jgi:hypothetical protein
MNPTDTGTLALRRLIAQRLAGPPPRDPEETVHHLFGVQAQDYGWAKWSVGLRLPDAVDDTVERAVAGGEIVRTWLMRGTLHFVSARDAGWLTNLLAPRILAGNKRRYRQLELDDETMARSDDVLGQLLAAGEPRTRAGIAKALEAAGIAAGGQRAPYLLQHAALSGLICLGPARGREPTYVLLAESIATAENLDRDEALARLARRYFSSYGPATIQDLAWWSGLTVSDARAALNSARQSLVRVSAGGKELWLADDWEVPADTPPAHLLPPFDGYLLGYRDRTAVLDPGDTKKVNAGGGMPRPTILVEGKVVGIWKRAFGSNSMEVRAELFHPMEEQKMRALGGAAGRLGAFYEMPVELVSSEWEKRKR